MSFRTNDFIALTDDLQSIFDETKAHKREQSVMKNFFDIITEKRRTHDHLLSHGVSGIKRIDEGADLPLVQGQQGDEITWIQKRYGALVSITKDMRSWDLYDQALDTAQTITEDAYDKIEQSYTDMWTQGWNVSYQDIYGDSISSIGADAQPLFSSAHTSSANIGYSMKNIINDGTNDNPVLSRVAIEKTKALALKNKSVAGITAPIMLDTLVVGPDLEAEARRLVESAKLTRESTVLSNETNVYLSSIKVVVCPWMGATASGVDTSAYWFMVDSSKIKKTFKTYYTEFPSLDAPEEVYVNKNWNYSIDYYYSRGFGFAPYIYGSKGDNS